MELKTFSICKTARTAGTTVQTLREGPLTEETDGDLETGGRDETGGREMRQTVI